MSICDFSSSDRWKALVLYGLNTATYKIALAKTLLEWPVHTIFVMSTSGRVESQLMVTLPPHAQTRRQPQS